MTVKSKVDVAVIGRGMLGSSAARHLADLGASVALIGPGEPADHSTHEGVFGSHHDSGRITRVLDRNPYYAKISAASIARYRGLESRTGITFFYDVGQITVSGIVQYLDELSACAVVHDLNHSILDNAGLAEMFPYLKFADGMTGIHEIGTAGHIDPRRFIAAQGELVQLAGGQVINETVTRIKEHNRVQILSWKDDGECRCSKVLLATGAFANHFGIIPEPISIEVAEHTVVFGEVSKDTAEILSAMPSVIYHQTDEIGGSVYILPPIKYPDGRTWLKIGQSSGHSMVDPEQNLIPWFQGIGDADIAEWLSEELSKVLPGTELLSQHTSSCVTTKSQSGLQFIDKFDGTEVYSCLVGEGQAAKSADELGRMAAHMVLYGRVPVEYDDFDLRIKYQ